MHLSRVQALNQSVVQPTASPLTPASTGFSGVVREIKTGGVLQPIVDSWMKTEKVLDTKIKTMPAQTRELFELQRMTNSLQLQTECAARVADSAGATVRRIQQLGGQ